MLITIKEYAAREGVTVEAIRARIRRGRIPAVKLGRDWLVESDVSFTDRRNRKEKITIEIIHEQPVKSAQDA